MPAAVIGAGIGLGAIGTIIGAHAQQNIAEGQLAAASAQQRLALSLAGATGPELDLINKQTSAYQNYLQFQQQDLQRQASLLTQYQSAQKDILSGKTPGFLSPMEQQFNLQRQQLDSRLRAAGGSGFSTSSAGMQQRAFNEQAIGQARLQGLGNIAALGQQTQQGINQGAMTSQGLADALLAQHNNIIARQVSAVNATPVYQYAGAGSVGAATMGAGVAGLGGGLTNAGTTALLYQNLPRKTG